MCNKSPVQFKPDGNDLKRVFYYYGIEAENKIVCPFHDDSRPSCHVNFEEGIFHCFACEVSGDAYQFVKLANPKLDELSKLILYFAILKSDKVKKLKLSKVRNSKAKKQKELDRDYEREMSQDYYFGLKTIKWEKVKSNYKDYMLKRGFTNDVLNKSGAKLTYTSENYPIIFPIMDNGTFKGSVCRTTNKRTEKDRKYLYNKGFSRVDTLAGDYNSSVVVLTEGYMDALKLKQFGLNNVAAILGWKITTKQVDKLKARGVKTIISALDLDGPGRKGTEYLMNFFDVVPFQFPTYQKDKRGKFILDDKGIKIKIKDPGDLNEWQFKIAYNNTKKAFRNGRK